MVAQKQSISFIDRHTGGDRGVLVHVDFNTPDAHGVEEFKELVRASGVECHELIQVKRSAPSVKYFVGKGVAESLRDAVLEHEANVVIFNHALTPAQGRNLEELCCCRVIDRTELILDIFAQRARSFEGKLQVELAQLEHLKTRLIRGWTHLERQKGGIGLRGPGETQLETDRRLLDVRIKTIRKRLEKVAKQRSLSRRQRQKNTIPSVSLVGYTNAGKSTLFNAVTQADAFCADQLFATLDPTLRHCVLPSLGKVILADTVGFIRDLPHDLIAAFKGTLEEAREANLLLHVLDCSHPGRRSLIDNVKAVLQEIEAHDVPVLYVYNKVDLVGDQPRIDYDAQGVPVRVWLSAVTGDGLDMLKTAIVERLCSTVIKETVVLSNTEALLRAKLYDIGAVTDETILIEGGWELEITLSAQDYRRFFPKEG